MNLPKFITFTGADEHTNIDRMVKMSAEWPIEWGILFSPERQGSGRYPKFSFINKLRDRTPWLRLSAHFCGGYTEDLIQFGALPIYKVFDFRRFLLRCQRIQINTTIADLRLETIKGWAHSLGCRAIVQCRSTFPDDDRVDWLYDCSGGRGIAPTEWPIPDSSHDALRLKGYAGGLGPDNVATAAKQIGEWDPAFYLDMESGVRDDGDRFDLEDRKSVV